MTPIKIWICLACLILLFSETAFGICIGCVLYNWLFPNKAAYCPGDMCVAKIKQPIQRINWLQALLSVTAFGVAGWLAVQAS